MTTEPLRASPEEIKANRRCRSARLRVFERLCSYDVAGGAASEGSRRTDAATSTVEPLAHAAPTAGFGLRTTTATLAPSRGGAGGSSRGGKGGGKHRGRAAPVSDEQVRRAKQQSRQSQEAALRKAQADAMRQMREGMGSSQRTNTSALPSAALMEALSQDNRRQQTPKVVDVGGRSAEAEDTAGGQQGGHEDTGGGKSGKMPRDLRNALDSLGGLDDEGVDDFSERFRKFHEVFERVQYVGGVRRLRRGGGVRVRRSTRVSGAADTLHLVRDCSGEGADPFEKLFGAEMAGMMREQASTEVESNPECVPGGAAASSTRCWQRSCSRACHPPCALWTDCCPSFRASQVHQAWET